MAEDQHNHGWWNTIPGILTGVAGCIAAVSGLIVALNQAGVFEKKTGTKLSEQRPIEIQKNPVVSESSHPPMLKQKNPVVLELNHPTMFKVNSKLGWQSTGLYVQKGEVVKIQYKRGQWKGSSSSAYSNPGNISPSTTTTADCFPVSETEAGAGALLAKIGEEGKPVDALKNSLVGEGYLYLRINDCDEWLNDNTGVVDVVIKVIQ